jgi:spore coat protein A, manganese oxidase
MAITRKEFLKLGTLGLVGGAGLALSSGASASSPWTRANGTTGNLLRSAAQLPKPFMIPLFVPPVLKPVRTDSRERRARATTDYYEITQKEGEAEILPGLSTPLWGYDGIFPGPTIESRSGRKVVVRYHNELPVPVTTHLHGGKTPPGSDGYPTDLILPKSGPFHTHHDHSAHPGWSFHRGSKDYVYPLEQRAATLWYHDHRMDFTGPQIWRGLAGFHVVRDDEEDALPLPKGEKDVPLMLCDRAFGEDGSFLYPARDPSLQGKPGVKGELHGRRPRRCHPRQRCSLALHGGFQHPLPLPDPQRLERPPLQARARS